MNDANNAGTLASKVRLLLQMLQSANGQIDASDHQNSLLNYFCDDNGRETDTFNIAIKSGFIRVTHDSHFDTSTAYLTDVGREAALSTPNAPVEPATTQVEWLEDAARYFEARPTLGEDMANWANVHNAEMCRKIAAILAVRLDEAAIRKDGWQPMDTVPKDRPFLLAVEDDGEIEYHSAKYVGADKSILIAGGAFGFDRAGKRLGWCEIKPIRNGGKQP